MKKQIISVLVLISLSFQLTYPVFEGLKETASRLYGKYGKARVNKAVAMIKKYKPRGLISRFKDAEKERDVAKNAFSSCMLNKCRKVLRNWSGWHVGDNILYPKGRVSVTAYNSCKNEHCLSEYNRFYVASDRLAKQGITIVAAIAVGAITTAMLAVAGVSINALKGVKRELQEQEEYELTMKRPRKWIGESPFYEEKKEWGDPSPLHEPGSKRLKQ